MTEQGFDESLDADFEDETPKRVLTLADIWASQGHSTVRAAWLDCDWKPNKKKPGNSTRWIGDKPVTVYRQDGGWKGAYDGRFYPEEYGETFRTEDDAKAALYGVIFGKRLPKDTE